MDENIAAFKYIDTPYIKRKNKFIDLFGDKINNNRFINIYKFFNLIKLDFFYLIFIKKIPQNYPKKVENIKIIFLIRKN